MRHIFTALRTTIKNKTLFLALTLLAVLALKACSGPKPELPTETLRSVRFTKPPKNIIFVIGDGMALSEVSASILWSLPKTSAFELFTHTGFHFSHSANYLITDSAAGATAFSCGCKAENNVVGICADTRQPCTTLLEEMKASGYAAGIVVTSSATHATPAAFMAHEDIRAFSENIAMDYLRTPVDCFIGGGENSFKLRFDKKNLLDSLTARGYRIVKGSNISRFADDPSMPIMAFVSEDEPKAASQGRRYLPTAAIDACKFLTQRSDKGFFLLVESSQIDWALHANDERWLRAEMLELEATLKNILAFAANNGETLVVVTGDHETSGMALVSGSSSGNFSVKFTNKLHTPVMVPVFAYGPGASLFAGSYDNTMIYWKMREALSLQPAEANTTRRHPDIDGRKE